MKWPWLKTLLNGLATLALPGLVVSVGVILMAWDPMLMRGLRNNFFDEYQRWQPRVYQEAPVRIIDIDEESLKRIGQWPWPRTVMAELITKLRTGGAAAIGVDVMFAEPDRTSPKAMLPLWQRDARQAHAELFDESFRQRLLALPDHDTAMTKAIAGGSVVLGFTVLGGANEAPQPRRIAQFAQNGPPGLPSLFSFDGALGSLAPFQQAADGHGAFSFVPDDDGVVRRVPLVVKLRGLPVPSLSAEMLRVGQGERNYVLTSAQGSDGAEAGLQDVRIGALTIPTTERGEVWLHYSGAEPSRSVPAWKVLAGQVPRSEMDGRLLLIGSSAQGLLDLRFSPLGQIIPGVEVHAQALEQMLTGNSLSRPGWAMALEVLALMIVGLAVGLLALRQRALLAAAVTLGAIGALFAGGWLAFTEYRLLLNPLSPSLFVLTSFVTCSLAHHFVSERRQRWVTQAFSRYVSPNVVNYLVNHPEELALGGSRRTCSFIFTDLQGFTSLLETMGPTQVVAHLNAYLDEMFAIVFRHEGTLDRILGDGIHVVFSAPVTQLDHRQRALDCAMAMHKFSKKHAMEMAAQGINFGHTRIGVHCGEAIVGNVGGSSMFDYRALGDPVNTTARLESVNKHLGTKVCVSDAILAGCPVALVRPVGLLLLKGKQQALKVFEPMDAEDELTRAPEGAYQNAYDLLAAPWAGDVREYPALKAFERLAQVYPQDPLVQLHLERLHRGESGDRIVLAEK